MNLVPKTYNIFLLYIPLHIIGKNVVIGIGVAIMAGAIINPYSQIGDFAIINTKTSVDHDCIIGKFSSLAPNVTLGGNVKIGDDTPRFQLEL
jgi:UDP-3-O-[3-hydroxymyristoyl] glucosamine N-acyltransferase